MFGCDHGACLKYCVLTVSQTSPAISCNLFYYFGAWGGVITQTTLSVIMILRLWALYEGSRRLAIVWGVLISIHITALCLIFGLGEEIPPFDTPIPYYTLDLNICFAPDSPPYFTGIWVSRLALDTILFFFVLWKAFEQYLKGWHSDIVELLITDNVVAFALVCLIQVGNLVIFLVATPQGAQGGVGFAIATDVIIGCRLLLHTKEVVYKRRDPYETEFGLEPASAFQANVTPKGRQSFAAALRDSYGGSTVSSDNLSRQFREIGGITLAPIGQVPAPDASRATRESQSSGSV